MINSAHLSSVLNGHHIPRGFYNTDRGFIPFGTGTDRTDIGIRDIMTFLAIADLLPHFYHCVSEGFHLRNILPEQVQSQPQRALSSDTRKPGEFRYGMFKEF
jgi:hypothetical protein